MKELILVTAGFPFGTGETFLETEVKYLAEGFDKVKIVAINPSNQTRRSLPENCQAPPLHIHVGSKEKLRALRFLFTGLFWKELKVIRKTYEMRLTKGMINTMLISLYRAYKIKSYLKKNINTNEQTFYSYWCDDAALALGLLKEEVADLKAISRIHRWDVYFDQSAVDYLPYRHFITKQLTTIFSISQDGIDYAKRVWKTGSDEKFQLSRLGINNESKLKKVERDYILIASCSNLIPVKHVHLIAEALQHMTSEKIHWVHIGDGPDRERIEDLIKHFPSNVSAELKGRIPNSAIYTYYNETRPNLFVNVSSSEGIPVSIMEAMSFGIPCIATDVGGNGEIVNEQNGKILAENPTPQEISDAICAFFDPSVFKLKSEGAFLTWKEQYNGEKNYTAFVKQLIQLH
jgi:glycosyltransferase involved in cell wall biosynthesis